MGSLSVFRLPQFSEDEAWLPSWLQHCNFDILNVESITTDQITFEQRVEELKFHWTGVGSGESLKEEGGFNIGQLFISGTDGSPFSLSQSANDGVQFHLCLSPDGDSEITDQITDACPNKSKCCDIVQPREESRTLGQGCVKLSFSPGSTNCSRPELEGHLDKSEMLKHDENTSCSEGAADVVELCIAASEALVINEVTESELLAKSCSASAILEASLQIKQARLEVWRDTHTFNGTSYIAGDISDLSDLDDIAMESAYEDAGHLNELHVKELSMSQVKDTFDSENDENIKHKNTTASATTYIYSPNGGHTNIVEGVIDSDMKLKEVLVTERLDSDKQNGAICVSVCGLGSDVGYQDNSVRTIGAHMEPHISDSTERANATTPGSNLRVINGSSSPNMSGQEKDNTPTNIIQGQEQFKSRWFGGWIINNDVKYTSMKHSIPQPFCGETSFLSESADVAPDQNSCAQNHDKEAMIASQLSTSIENFRTTVIDGMLLSQDIRSSNTSLADPLCSVVPCSISENVCSSPAVEREDKVHPCHFNVTIECNKNNIFQITPLDNDVAQREKVDMPIGNIEELRNGVSRRFTSLRDYSKLPPNCTKFSPKHGHWESSSLMQSNIDLTSQENHEETVKVWAEVSNKENTHTLPNLVKNRSYSCFRASISSTDEDNAIRTSQPKTNSRFPDSEKKQQTLLQCKTRSAQKLRTSKRVHFCERETNIPEKKRLKKVQSAPKTCSSTRAFKRSTRFSAPLKSGAPQMDRYLKKHLDKEKRRLILQNMEFFLTGFSHKTEMEIEGLIRQYGGIILSQIPPINLKGKRRSIIKSQALPIVLCLKKTNSFKFLYGCAVNAYVLKVNWLHDSLAAGRVLPPKKYMILPRNISRRQDQVYTAVNYDDRSLVFNNLGVMLHGKTKYFANIATIIKHGGGQIFNTLQILVQALEAGVILTGIIVARDESFSSRHLKQCALEQNIPITSVQWIMKSLYAGQLVPLEEKNNSRHLPAVTLQRRKDLMELSQEI
ncbi:BRCA1 C Terminus domain containing protein [Striga asiatica]|uniref:BRCA1 C Terminus domain containing protein n=1 Tax=Striga asiatica TaxID=4170 RepID=A0A5A7P6Z9_STRAF|nr:BRCA1 C Terminus domain containing protein [Striga asiatica]